MTDSSSSSVHHHHHDHGGSRLRSSSSASYDDDIVHTGHHHHHRTRKIGSGPDAVFKSRQTGIQYFFILAVFIALAGFCFSLYKKNQDLQRKVLTLAMTNAALAEKIKTLEQSASETKDGNSDSQPSSRKKALLDSVVVPSLPPAHSPVSVPVPLPNLGDDE